MEPAEAGTRVTLRCEGVSAGMGAADHEAALRSRRFQRVVWVNRGQGA